MFHAAPGAPSFLESSNFKAIWSLNLSEKTLGGFPNDAKDEATNGTRHYHITMSLRAWAAPAFLFSPIPGARLASNVTLAKVTKS